MGRLIVATALSAALGMSAIQVFSQGPQSETTVFTRTKGGEMVAELPNQPGWCQPNMTFTVRGTDDSYFKEGETDEQGRQGRFILQKLLAGTRIRLKRDCPEARSITFNGFVDDVFIYRGYAEKGGKEGDWILVEMPINLVEAPTPPPPAVVPPPEEPRLRPESVAECNALAAHPDDPTKPKSVKGVSDDNLEAGKAAEKCEEAIEVEPDNPRIRYQLARAYIAYGKDAEGLELMTEAAEEGHPVAIASLGDVALYGVLDDEPDPETAKALYLQAATKGFKPAAKLAAEIVDNPKEDKSQEVVPEPEFTRPEYAKMVMSGEVLPDRDVQFVLNYIYVTSFMSGIKYQCEGAGVKGLDVSRVMQAVYSRLGLRGEMAMRAWNEGSYGDLEQDAMDDGYALAVAKGCSAKEIEAVRNSIRKTFL